MKYRIRRAIAVIVAVLGAVALIFLNPESYEEFFGHKKSLGLDYEATATDNGDEDAPLALELLERLEVKGRAPKTGYSREQFYDTWPIADGCSLRQRIIKREFGDSARFSSNDECTVVSGEFNEPYTGEYKKFVSKGEIANGIQIDHVVALSDAWQKGAQKLDAEKRYELATDPLNLLAVDATANMNKSDGDAATWLPSNKGFRCQYVARQVSVKYKYGLWVTSAEKEAIERILSHCPEQRATGID